MRFQCNENDFSEWCTRGKSSISEKGIVEAHVIRSARLCPNFATGVTTLMLSGVNDHLAARMRSIAGCTVMEKNAVGREGSLILLELRGRRQGMC